MKEDILEQLVDDYLNHLGYFTIHNVKYRPGRQTPSDIDVIGYSPTAKRSRRVLVVNCKSWQSGFDVGAWENAISGQLTTPRNRSCEKFRELAYPTWSQALGDAVDAVGASKSFVHVTAVTRAFNCQNSDWSASFKAKVGNDFAAQGYSVQAEILTVDQMLNDLYAAMGTTLASSQVGRLIQVIKASGWTPPLLPKKNQKAQKSNV
jgi:hypothetical protein